MRVAQEKVRQFHERFNYPAADRPTVVGPEVVQDRYMIMHEEINEYLEAGTAGDLVKIADALGDTLYTVLGTAVVHGIDLQPILDEIHRSNMTKGDPDPNKPLKPTKGDGFEPPRLAELLLIQSSRLND